MVLYRVQKLEFMDLTAHNGLSQWRFVTSIKSLLS